MDQHKFDLIVNLLRRQSFGRCYGAGCSDSVKDAMRVLAEDLLCDLKFDRALFNELLMAYGWTPDDVEFFEIGDLFIDDDIDDEN